MRVRKNSASRWARKAAASGQDYTEGIADPRADWADQTLAAKAAFTQGVQQAIARDGWAKGVSKAGTERWRKRAGQVGPGRFSEGVGLGQGDYAEGVAPYLSKIEQLTLPARGPKGDPRNIQRVAVIATALHELKVGAAGGGH
jgi:hypothetical protein